jgi:hypothetical protein
VVWGVDEVGPHAGRRCGRGHRQLGGIHLGGLVSSDVFA